MPYDLKPVTVQPGVAPSTDSTPQSTPHYVYTDKVRFVEGFPEKIGGWLALIISGPFMVNGCARTIFSYVLNNIVYYLIGTHSNLYQIQGNTLFNATPVVTTNTTLVDVLATNYATLGTDPFTVSVGTLSVVVTDPSHAFGSGDVLTFSGATGFAGLAAGDLNGARTIVRIDDDSYSFTISTVPTSSGSGGGAAIDRASRIVSVADPNDYQEGDNIEVISVASAVGGIDPADMVGIRVIRNVTALGYDFEADATATSSAVGGGDFVFREEIPNGTLNPTSGSGYGLGLYGVGLYGVSKISSTPTPPTIWSFDRFGNLVVMTPGNQTGLYSWNSATSTLPTLVTNAPTAINYVFVSDNIAVTLGANDTPNRIQWSDQGALTVWTSTAANRAGQDDIEGAGQFLSHAALRGFNLLFTEESVYTFRYINKPFVWETKQLDPSRGLIAQNARVVVNGVAYWMGSNNLYMYRGGNVEVIPSNTSSQSTMRKYIYQNLNLGQKSKFFAWYNVAFNEIWFHYASSSSSECDRIARLNVLDFTWCPDTMARTAGEYPNILQQYPLLANYDSGEDISTPYQHENGYNDNGVALPWISTTPYFSTGAKQTVNLGGVYPDNTISEGTIQLTVNTKRYPQQSPGSSTYDISAITYGEFDSGFDSGFDVATLSATLNITYRKSCRYWQYSVSGSSYDQFWRAGMWMESYKKSGFR